MDTTQDFEATWSRYVKALEEFRQANRDKAAARAAAQARDPNRITQPTPLKVGPL